MDSEILQLFMTEIRGIRSEMSNLKTELTSSMNLQNSESNNRYDYLQKEVEFLKRVYAKWQGFLLAFGLIQVATVTTLAIIQIVSHFTGTAKP